MSTVDRGDTFAVAEPEVEAPEAAEVETTEVEAAEVAEVAEVEVAEAEVKAEPAPKERDEKGKFIPLNRHEAVLNNERAARELAERKLAELQASLKQVDRNADAEKLEAEIVSLEKEHTKLLLDGDSEQAAAVMSQIRLKERTISIQQTANVSASVKNEMREELREDTAIESLEATYDVLNPQHEAYDEEKVSDVLGWKAIFMSRDRMTPSAALIKAAAKVMIAPAQAAAKTDDSVGLAAGKVIADRKAEQVARNIVAAKQQPASMKDSGIDSDKAGIKNQIEYTKLSVDEREALPEATRARLRGDML